MQLPPNSEVNLPEDLDKARDEKCIPIAREIMQEMAGELLTGYEGEASKGDHLFLSFLEKTLNHDLNITTEAQYLSQLILGGLTGLNNTVHMAEGLVPLDEERYAHIGQELLQIMCDANVRLNKTKAEELEADWQDAKLKIQELFEREKLNKLESEYILGNIFETFKDLNNRVAQGLEQATTKAECKILGIEFMSDLTVGMVNKVLVNDVKVEITPPTPPAPPEGLVEPPVDVHAAGDGQVAPPEPAPEAETPAEDAAEPTEEAA